MSANKLFGRIESLGPDYPLTVIGLGNPDRADDGCGLLVASKLKARFQERAFLETQRSAESLVLDFLEEGKKRAVLFVDASDFGGRPGTCQLFDSDDASRFASDYSTHKVPITLLIGMLSQKRIPCFLLGIQPETLEFLGEMSPAVKTVADEVAEGISAMMDD